MTIPSSLTRLSIALIAAMGLSACHDHHHNSNNNNNDDDDQLAVEVQVLDGALNGALVFADLNRNFELDREEPYTYTDENGKATLKILNSSLKDPSGNTVNSFKMIAQAEKGDPDLIYGSETPLTTPVVMAREIFPGSIDGLIALSPFTTLTDMMVFPDALSSLTPETYQAMLTDIATAAGAGNAGVAGGFNDAITNENLHALIAAELLVRSGLIPGSLKDLAAVYNGSVVGNSPLETAASIKDDANTMVTELEENAQKEDRDITGDDVVKALTGYNPGGDTPDPDSGSDTDPDSGSDTDPDSGSDTDPDSGSDTDPDSGSGSDSDSETSMFDARLIMGGYVPEVQVCWDANNTCDKGDSSVSTDENGLFSLSFTAEQAKQIASAGYLDLVTLIPAGSTDIVLGAPGTVTEDVAVSTRVYAPNLRNSKDAVGSYTNVNIFEALTALTFGTDDNLSAAGFSDRLDSVALALGLNPKTVRSDYNNVKKPTLENIRAVISGELLQKYGIMPGSFKALQNQRKTPVDLATLLANLERIKAIVDPIVASLAEQIAGVKDPTEIIREMVDSSKYLDAAFVSLASGNGDNFMCGVTGAGTVKCWGQGSWGNLGNGTWYEDALSKNGQDAATQSETAAATDPATLPGMYTHEPQTVTRADGTPLTGVAMVETGLRYACAVTVTGEVWCWGDNSLGQLGQGSDSIDLERPAVPVASQVVKGRQNGDGKYFANAVNLYLANDTACARTANNELYCWGDNTVMQTGDRRPDDEVTEPYKALIDSESVSAEDMAIAAVPHPVLVMDHVVDVSAGDDSFYAVTDGEEADTESQMINEERLYDLLGWGPFRRSNLYGWGADPASLRTDVSDLLPRNESGQVDYKEAEDFRQRYNLITHLNNQWGDRYHQTPEPMDGDGWTCYGEDGKKYTSPDDIRLIADAHYNSEQTDPDANYKNTYNNKDQLENTHFGKQWLVPTMKLTSPRPVIVTTVKLNFSGKKNIGGAMGTYMTAAPESLYKSLCDDKTQNCYLDKFRFTGVHVGHIYDRFPIGALQLTPDAVGNRDAVVTVSFEDSSGATRFVTLKQGFTKKMLTCTKTVGNTGQDSEVKRDVVIRKAVPALYYPNNYNSGAEGGMVLKDCRHPNEKGSSWGDECADATKIKGFLPSQDKAREVTRTVSGEEVKVSEEPQVGHPKKGEYTLQKMSPKDAKKICAEHYDKKKDYEGYLKCQLALRGSVKYQGYNPFGQAGKAPSKVNGNVAPQALGVILTAQYPEGSYAAYESAWSYIINDLNLHNLEYESDDVREQETARLTEELREYMGTYNNGYMWATNGCGGSAVVDNYWLVGLGNNFSCKMTQGGISTGNALVNSVLLNTAFYDATPEDKYKDFSGMEPGDLPANRIAGSSTICADAKVCPEIVYDADDEDSGEGRE